MTAIAFLDVNVFNQKPSLRTLFHRLVHVTQFVLIGTERVIRGYFKTLNEAGLWMVVPFRRTALPVGCATLNPLDVLSVEDEVREWMRTGRH